MSDESKDDRDKRILELVELFDGRLPDKERGRLLADLQEGSQAKAEEHGRLLASLALIERLLGPLQSPGELGSEAITAYAAGELSAQQRDTIAGRVGEVSADERLLRAAEAGLACAQEIESGIAQAMAFASATLSADDILHLPLPITIDASAPALAAAGEDIPLPDERRELFAGDGMTLSYFRRGGRAEIGLFGASEELRRSFSITLNGMSVAVSAMEPGAVIYELGAAASLAGAVVEAKLDGVFERRWTLLPENNR